MNILILGGNGFLGKNCTERLAQKNNLTVVDLSEHQQKLKNIKYEISSLSNVEKIMHIIEENNIEMVMHLVSSLIPTSVVEEYIKDTENIYFPSLRLLDYCATKNIKFVYFSSGGAIYGNQCEVFNENTKREPISLYGLSKLNFENAILFYHNVKNLQYLIIRPSNPYGPGQNIHGKQGLIAVIIGKIIDNEPIEIWGDGTVIKDFIYIDDFVVYVDMLITGCEAWNSSYNIGSGIGTSVNDIIQAFKSNSIDLPSIKYIEQKKTDVSRMVLDCTKIQKLFNYKCTSIEDGIKKYYDFVKNKVV